MAERLELAARYGIETLDLNDHEEISETIREMTDGRGADATICWRSSSTSGSPGTTSESKRPSAQEPGPGEMTCVMHAGMGYGK